MVRWMLGLLVCACSAAVPAPLENRARPLGLEDLPFLAGCWRRVDADSAVEEVRWERTPGAWRGSYKRAGPIDHHEEVELLLTTSSSDGLELASQVVGCGPPGRIIPCLAFEAHGRARPVSKWIVFGSGGTALWLGRDLVHDGLLFGRGEAQSFARCEP